jgi:hypothetical protein
MKRGLRVLAAAGSTILAARKPAEDASQPIIFYNRFAYWWRPHAKASTIIVNSIIDNWRMVDLWFNT